MAGANWWKTPRILARAAKDRESFGS